MQDDNKRNRLREKLARELYRKFRSSYDTTENEGG